MIQPTLSAIMPNYNHAQFLPMSLGALLSQSRPADELLVLDDCSTDNSWELLQAMAARHPALRCYRNEKNLGVMANVNQALRLAKSDYVYFPAADDAVLPGFFEATMNCLSAHPQAALGCSIGHWTDAVTGKTLYLDPPMATEPRYFSPEQMVASEQRGEFRLASQTIIYKREALLRLGGYPQAARWHADWFVAHVAGFRDGICYVPQVMTVFNVHQASYNMVGRRHKPTQREVLRTMVALLEAPEHAPSARRIHQSGAFALFGKAALYVMLARPHYWRYLTPAFVRKTLVLMARQERKKWQRTWAKRWSPAAPDPAGNP